MNNFVFGKPYNPVTPLDDFGNPVNERKWVIYGGINVDYDVEEYIRQISQKRNMIRFPDDDGEQYMLSH